MFLPTETSMDVISPLLFSSRLILRNPNPSSINTVHPSCVWYRHRWPSVRGSPQEKEKEPHFRRYLHDHGVDVRWLLLLLLLMRPMGSLRLLALRSPGKIFRALARLPARSRLLPHIPPIAAPYPVAEPSPTSPPAEDS
ncbi:hypothetical protein N7453_004386 [Penicillium expansum]|nr:hypothetical protein N7453_004386 [Penicillium expansum]